MSISFAKSLLPHFLQAVAGREQFCRRLHEPDVGAFFFNDVRHMVHDVLVEQELPQSLQVKAMIGTPHARWREMHQSGRFSHHAEEAVLAPGRHPGHLVGILDGLFQQVVRSSSR